MKSHRLLLPVLLLALAGPASAADLPKAKVELQPLAAQARRVADALELLGAPLAADERKALADAKDADAVQAVLDKHCLIAVHVRAPEGGRSAVTLAAEAGPARPELAEQGWRVFLVKVYNEPALDKLELRADSPNAAPLTKRSSGKPDPQVGPLEDVEKRFLDLAMYNDQPLVRDLSGLELEYRILQIYCRDAGRKEASLSFGLWRDGDKDKLIAAGNAVEVVFDSAPAVLVKFHVRDDDGKSERNGKPVMAAFTITDSTGRIYPARTRRLAPDFNFHPQIYRADGETVSLQPGTYTFTWTRGPEYLVEKRTVTVAAPPKGGEQDEAFALKRWVHPATSGWYSGDHHIHAAGCAHYESPTEGVTPEDMMRHVLGEDLDVGCCLSWGPCWYHQKRYFEGKVNALSTADNLLRYDVEVSGFPSSHCGHVCLLRLREQDYPGTKLIGDWPSWDLPIFAWAKQQNAVVGFAHSGWGLEPVDKDNADARKLPNQLLPKMDGIGANEYVVDVTQDACDFISTVDTPSVWELNMWYHTLDCGYRCRISGETDFPCIFGERVGLGRSYVHLDGKLNFDDWAEGIKRGRCYVSDGKSHLMDFTVNGLGVGEKDDEIRLKGPDKVEIKARVAALLEAKPTDATNAIRKAPLTQKPYWDIERARIGDTRTVPLEVVVNGVAVEHKDITADGTEQEVTFSVPIQASSWVCLRIFPSSHTNPVFVVVGDKPVRVSKRSAEWCLKAVDACWDQKKKAIRPNEQPAAQEAYDKARAAYKKIAEECAAD
jgi:hypothetical protein